MKNLSRFWCWRFYRFFFYREVKPLQVWFNPHLFKISVSLCEELELVVIYKTSPSSSKTESGRKRYRVFRKACFAEFWGAGPTGSFPASRTGGSFSAPMATGQLPDMSGNHPAALGFSPARLAHSVPVGLATVPRFNFCFQFGFVSACSVFCICRSYMTSDENLVKSKVVHLENAHNFHVNRFFI